MMKYTLFLKFQLFILAELELFVLILGFASVPIFNKAIAEETLISKGNIPSLQKEAAFTFQILYASDFETSVNAIEDSNGFSAVIDALRQTLPNTIFCLPQELSTFCRASAYPSFF